MNKVKRFLREVALNVSRLTKTRGKPRPSGRVWIAFDFEGL